VNILKVVATLIVLFTSSCTWAESAPKAEELIQAIRNVDIEKSKLLLSQGISPKVDYISGVPLIFFAVESGNAELVNLLLENGANSNSWARNSMPIIISAAYQPDQCSVEILEALISYGAKLNIRDKAMGMLPIHAAAESGNLECLDYLVNIDGTDSVSMFGENAIYHASIGGHVDVIKYLINAGYSVTRKTSFGFTALMVAAGGGHLETIKLLLSHGAEGCAKDSKGRTSRDIAVEKKHFDVANALPDCSDR